MPTVVSMDTSPSTYVLFLDLLEVEDMLLVEQVVGQAEKHPANPVIAPGNVEDWDADRATNWAGTIAFDPADGLFKAWYYGRDRDYKGIDGTDDRRSPDSRGMGKEQDVGIRSSSSRQAPFCSLREGPAPLIHILPCVSLASGAAWSRR